MAIATNSYKENCARWHSPADNTDALPHKSVAVSEHLLQLMAWGEIYAAGTGFVIGTAPDTVRAPDVSFVSRERAEATAEERGFFPGAPDLAVEVISPNDRYSEIEEKVSDWLRAGTQMVVVIDPHQRTATVYRAPDDICILTEGDMLDGGDVVPGWKMPLADVF